MENVYLLGSEEVSRAGQAMRAAADDMQRAAMNIDGAFERHQRFLDDWLARFEAVMNPPAPAPVAKPVPDDVRVWVKKKDGTLHRAIAGDIQWRHFGNVIAWQVDGERR